MIIMSPNGQSVLSRQVIALVQCELDVFAHRVHLREYVYRFLPALTTNCHLEIIVTNSTNQYRSLERPELGRLVLVYVHI